MSEMHRKVLQLNLRTNMITGALMLLPVIAGYTSIFPEAITFIKDVEVLNLLVMLILWNIAGTWFIRLRKEKDLEINLAVLLLTAGITVAVFMLSNSLGLGPASIFFAGAIPLAISGMHVRHIYSIIEDGQTGGGAESEKEGSNRQF